MPDPLAIFPRVEDVFDPGPYNNAELQALLDLDLGKSPLVLAEELAKYPADLRFSIEPALQRFFDLQQLKDHKDQEWCGADIIRSSCELMIEYRKQYQANKLRTGVGFHPSLHTSDSRGNQRYGGIGSDSGRVRTYKGADGERIPFAVNLLTGDTESFQWAFQAPAVEGALGNLSEHKPSVSIEFIRRERGENGIIECPICGHAETFSLDSAGSEHDALHAMGRHCQTARDEVEAHMLLFNETHA